MPKGPAVVVVARHGARLDAADKSWHLTSPTPYDPPLTYGGWSQGKALGLRIAALLHQRDVEATGNSSDRDHAGLDSCKTEQPPRKKRKIIIHTSPYLRCIQTSTAVAAGMSQFHPPTAPHLTMPSPSKEKTEASEDTQPAKPPQLNSYSLRPSTLQPLADSKRDVSQKHHTGPDKILLRIDAFLGEWLSPDYFDDITPPPNSTMMVAAAKADLLRRGDYIHEMSDKNNSKGFFPGGWVAKGATASKTESNDGGTSSAKGSLASASPFRERSGSQGSPPLQRKGSREKVASAYRFRSRLYKPPVPSYSVSTADVIPRGYFAHAREACILVDFQWDSMRPPHEWGDGGEYGDEWSTMHKRFRKGLAGMMSWYTEHGAVHPKEQISGFMFKEPLRLTPHPVSKRPTESLPTTNGNTDVEEDEELVLILLTHGAGCNALLGAITNQPVLIDVGLASLSMAVRRKEPRTHVESAQPERRPSVADPGMSDTYDMKLMASVDHLKAGVDPSKLPAASQANTPIAVASPSLESRRRFTGSSGTNSPLESPFTIGDPFRNWNSSLGSMRRTMSSGSNRSYMQSHLNSSEAASSSTGGGLWSSPKLTPVAAPNLEDGKSIAGANMILDFANQKHTSKPNTSDTKNDTSPSIPPLDGTAEITNELTKLNTNEQREVSDSVAPLPKQQSRSATTASTGLWGAKPQPKANTGLWGPPRKDDVYEHRRGPQPKRRWTLVTREESV